MGLFSVLLAVTYSIVVLVWVEVADLRQQPNEGALVITDTMAPRAWERRFVQTSDTTGREVMMLRRSNEAGYWMAAASPEGVVKVAYNDKRNVRTAIQGPRVGVAYAPIGDLTDPQKAILMAHADVLAAGGTAGVQILAMHQARSTGVRRYLGMVMTTPAVGWRMVRWSMRTPSRAVGFLAIMWVMTEGLQVAGFFEFIREKAARGQSAAQNVKDRVAQASAFVSEIIDVAVATYAGIGEYVAPSKLPAWAIALWYIYRWFMDAQASDTPLSTPEVSEAGSSGCETPPENPRSRALVSIGEAVSSQHEMLEQVVQKLGEIQMRRQDDVERVLEKEMIRNAKLRSAAEERSRKQGKTWEMMREKMRCVESLLRGGRGDADGDQSLSLDRKEDRGEISKVSEPETQRPTPETEWVSPLIRKLKRQGRAPQEIFAEALRDYAEEEEEFWATHFSPAFRERIAPSFLGEIYALGTAKQWAKDWIRDKSLGDCNEAREIIPACASIDSIFVVEQRSGAINEVNVEKLARKVLGIRSAFASVSKDVDWRKPRNAKGWKTVVDKEAGRRIDPHFQEKEYIAENRDAEDESRTELDREASMLNAEAEMAVRVEGGL